jgi:hypothetical protein
LHDMLAADAAAERAERESVMALLLAPDAAPPGSTDASENVPPAPSAEPSKGRDDEP